MNFASAFSVALSPNNGTVTAQSIAALANPTASVSVTYDGNFGTPEPAAWSLMGLGLLGLALADLRR